MNQSESTYYYDIGGRKTVRWIIKRLEDRFHDIPSYKFNVLDIGCGTCQLTKIVAEKFNCNITAVDIDANSIKKARSIVMPENIELLVANVEENVLQGDYDVILMTQVLDHLKNPLNLMTMVTRNNLKDKGIILIGISNGYGMYEKSKKRHGFNTSYMKNDNAKKLITLPYTCNIESPHIWKFSKTELEKLTKTAGLKITKFKNITFLLPAYPFNKLFFSSCTVLGKILDDIDGCVADVVPHLLASNWFFECVKQEGDI